MVSVVIAGLSGCGFKSDLFIPEPESETPLFIPDAPAPGLEAQSQAEAAAQEVPPFLPAAANAEGEEISLDAAADGNILVTPDNSGDGSSDSDAEGVAVNLSELTRDVELERERNAQ